MPDPPRSVQPADRMILLYDDTGTVPAEVPAMKRIARCKVREFGGHEPSDTREPGSLAGGTGL
jgi:hypothetical protein